MSDEEREFSEDEEAEDAGPSEAELAMQKRRQVSTADLDESAAELLEQNLVERQKMEAEINEMRARSERRKREREEEERRMAERRAEEEAKRKADEEERRRKKEEEEQRRREERAKKLAEHEQFQNPGRPNFIITKKRSEAPAASETAEAGEEKKSKEQLEEEKRAILNQRIKPLTGLDDMGTAQLCEKAKELHDTIYRLECDKYALEKRFRTQQVDMMDLAEKARKLNVVGKTGLKRLTDESDIMQEKFAGCPSKIEMYSRFERQKDKRGYGDRRTLYTGPQYLYPADKITPTRVIEWQEGGMPQYKDLEGAEQQAE